jgi:Undecaprenyl-phosphate galactose phosphotransferase WbaP
VGLSPVEEIRKLFFGTSIGFLLMIAFTLGEPASTRYSRLMLLVAWLAALFLVQLNRWLARVLARKRGVWGEPVLVIGSGPQGRRIAEFLKQRIRLGLLPVMMVNGFSEYDASPLPSIHCTKIRTAVLVIPEVSKEMQRRFMGEQRFGFHQDHRQGCIDRVILISSIGIWGSVGITPVDLDGIIGLSIANTLMRPLPNLVKRLLDLSIAIIGGTVFFPLFLMIAIAIKIDSPGSVFYRQKRIGKDGQDLLVWKFRTMRKDADQVLTDLLASDPAMKQEWEKDQKLRNDPRVTRLGRFLRKFSLDEFPQLINVLKGEMSLVGPRPIVASETHHYEEIFEKYKKVKPGMTGMWQVSGRNDTGYGSRVALDEYYINNWSPWLDIYIIIRTAREVLFHRGAY